MISALVIIVIVTNLLRKQIVVVDFEIFNLRRIEDNRVE